MPLYDYKCSKCGHLQEAIHSMSTYPDIKCEDCQEPCHKTFINAPNVQGEPTTLGSYWDRKRKKMSSDEFQREAQIGEDMKTQRMNRLEDGRKKRRDN